MDGSTETMITEHEGQQAEPGIAVPVLSLSRAIAILSRWVLLPGAVYLVAFTAFTWPWMGRFSSHLFADSGDGLQNIWNNWWVNRAVTHHQSPWFTDMLHHPHGVTLLGQTMNSFNGFVGIVLMKLGFSLIQTYNIMVAFSFVVGGLTACWLCFHVTRHYQASIIGGFVFTFSAFHFASGMGFMQIVSLEWIPLFILLFWKLVTVPKYSIAIGCAVTIALVLLCDYYYFLYTLAAGVLITIYTIRKGEFRRSRPLAVGGALMVLLCAPLPLLLVRVNAHDKLRGFHSARKYSTDVLSTFIDGGLWRFGGATNWYWDKIHSARSSSSVYISVVVLVALIIVFRRRATAHRDARFWIAFTVIFWIMSLGPRLLIFGKSRAGIPLPYALLERLLPPLKIGGMPYRTMVMVTIGGAVVVAIWLSHVNFAARNGVIFVALICAVFTFEVFPKQLPNANLVHPPYVDALRELPGSSGVIDGAAPSVTWQLYYQTIHEKPIFNGYISRVPASVDRKNAVIGAEIERGHFARLCSEFRFRYVAVRPTRAVQPIGFAVVYRGQDAIIYDLRSAGGCE